MSEAREVLDRLTAAVDGKDAKAVAECYAEDAVAVTPDEGEIRGRERITDYLMQFANAFADLEYKYLQKHDAGNIAIDEGTSLEHTLIHCPLPRARLSHPRESRSMFEAAMSPRSKAASSRSIVSTSTRWSF